MPLDSSIMLLEWCHNMEHHTRGVIYDNNMFIEQATDITDITNVLPVWKTLQG